MNIFDFQWKIICRNRKYLYQYYAIGHWWDYGPAYDTENECEFAMKSRLLIEKLAE